MKEFVEIVEAVDKGSTFYVDYKSKTIKVNKKTIISNGEWGEMLPLEPTTKEQALDELRRMYAAYKRSVPTERTRPHYFLAVPYEELSRKEINENETRDTAQVRLEAYLLLRVMDGTLDPLSMAAPYWQDKDNDKTLIIWREWFGNTNH